MCWKCQGRDGGDGREWREYPLTYGAYRVPRQRRGRRTYRKPATCQIDGLSKVVTHYDVIHGSLGNIFDGTRTFEQRVGDVGDGETWTSSNLGGSRKSNG